MDVFLEILKLTIPALIVFLTAWFFLRSWGRNEAQRRKQEFNLHLKDEILPMRLQAYERVILFLERIAPESILMRMNRSGMTASQLQSELQATIRHEYEHNLVQQTYISSEAWQRVLVAKGQITKIINESAAELKPGASASTLGKLILEKVMEVKTPPTQAAVEYLKQEVKELFF